LQYCINGHIALQLREEDSKKAGPALMAAGLSDRKTMIQNWILAVHHRHDLNLEEEARIGQCGHPDQRAG
jgi:hypothetical protein